jgi:hypothetical protein
VNKAPWLILGVLLLTACAGNVQWRESSASPPPAKPTLPDLPYLDVEHYQTTLNYEPGVNLSAKVKAYPRPHSIAYIEFDDQGDFQDRHQLVDALANIPAGPNRLVVFYAHGWQNNTRSADVGQFNALLAHLSHALNERDPGHSNGYPWEVYGVYLGWRGTLYDPSNIYPAQPLSQQTSVECILKKAKPSTFNTLASGPKLLTFWSRKDAAGRMAGAPLPEAINMISARARTKPTPAHVALQTKTILIGHSFGAFVIEKTVLQSISAIQPQMTADGTSYITPPADLVILLNSAAPAIYAKEFIEFLKWHGVGRDQPPFVISVSSEADDATKIAFPAGTIPASAFDIGSYRGADTYHGANEKTFFTHTPGHTDYLPSFDAYPTSKLPAQEFSSDYENEWIFYRNLFPDPTDFTRNDHAFIAWDDPYAKTSVAAPSRIWQLKPTRAVDASEIPFNDTPYWLVRVPANIIANHGDVWCANSMNLLTSLIRLSGIVDNMSALRKIKLSPEAAPAEGHDQLVPLVGYQAGEGK